MGCKNLVEIRIYLKCPQCKTEQMHRIWEKPLEEVVFTRQCVKCKKNILNVSNIYDDSIDLTLKIIGEKS